MTELLLFLAGVVAGLMIVAIAVGRSRKGQVITVGSSATATELAPDPSDSTGLAILDRLNEGVVLLDERLRPVLFNAAARRILGFRGDGLPARLPAEEVVVVARQARDRAGEVEDLLTLWFPKRSTLKARAIPTVDGVLVVLEDVTDELLSQQVRREFVAHASHELKSPVASLQALAEAVHQASEDDPEAVGRFSYKMVAEATRLGRLISDLLDLSRLEEPGGVPDQPADLSRVALRQLGQVRVPAQSKDMELESRIQPGVWVRGDEQQLALMIRNLLENAIRYTPHGGRVILEVTRVEDDAILSVTDTGIGIPLEAQARVFERFYRVDKARSRDRGGTGLGLAIVKHVAELHGGDVSVRSQLGEGSTFTTRLPAQDPEPPASSLAG